MEKKVRENDNRTTNKEDRKGERHERGGEGPLRRRVDKYILYVYST